MPQVSLSAGVLNQLFGFFFAPPLCLLIPKAKINWRPDADDSRSRLIDKWLFPRSGATSIACFRHMQIAQMLLHLFRCLCASQDIERQL